MNFKDELAGDGLDDINVLPVGHYTAEVKQLSKNRFNSNRTFSAQITAPQLHAGKQFTKEFDTSKNSHKIILKQLYEALPDDGSNLVQMELSHFNGLPYVVRFTKVNEAGQANQTNGAL
jgi:hypothetical protein